MTLPPEIEQAIDKLMSAFFNVAPFDRVRQAYAAREALVLAIRRALPLVSVSPSEEAVAAIRTTLEGFDKGVFVRNTEGDSAPDWAIKAFPYIRALAVLAEQFGSPAIPTEPESR